MKFYVYHVRGMEIPGAYPEGEPASEKHVQPMYLDIPDEQIGAKLLEFSTDFDVMIRGPKGDFPHYSLWFDVRGYRFTQR
jgi:hypothetical protein